jgi:hypothetical protein
MPGSSGGIGTIGFGCLSDLGRSTVDTMWGTDLTATFTGEGQAAVFIAVDHCSGECVGIHAHARATRFEGQIRVVRIMFTPPHSQRGVLMF